MNRKTFAPLLATLGCLAALGTTNAAAQQQKDFKAAISPDGKRMAYYSYRGEALPDLFLADVDGSNEQQLTHTPDRWEIVPSWSPDGQSLIYSAGPSMADLEIYQIFVENGEVKQLTKGEGKGHAAVWMPDGKSILYSRMYPQGRSEIVQKWLNSDKENVLTPDRKDSNLSPIVSPDGKHVAFISNREDGQDLDIFVADVAFDTLTQITSDDIRQDFITWAPDSQNIVFSAPNEAGKHDLYAIDINSRKQTRLTHSEVDHQYFSAFSADGRFIYFDQGDWSRNFFVYRAPWSGQTLTPELVTGKDWVDTIALMEQAFLAPMVGKWRGVSTHGNAKGRFEERSHYYWAPNNKSLLVDMELYWDGQLYGKASGLLGLDREQQKVFFNLTMEDGTVVMQEQTNPGEAANWQMQVASHGLSRLYPKQMYVSYSRSDDASWKSEIYMDKDGKRTLVDVHEFTRQQ
ncbi:DPP IV N-terminal domain-containing protein [Aliiglaciecola sp. CAU 1673]|uniref:DPP IV N-terminal domain-containing protein n=1 Tax=Aliiglaciecola sp. CAU 1673 TaxID=3032595 RepID=UPI0023DAA03A|nr:DPP IV N-terminal domain-containing protein [Aliiglaciecola sp. CAU 1673]MDF2176640.1 DPP IV N-terminal domain-containing protein [Aliiglaciecola sp. CAU 1673]